MNHKDSCDVNASECATLHISGERTLRAPNPCRVTLRNTQKIQREQMTRLQ